MARHSCRGPGPQRGIATAKVENQVGRIGADRARNQLLPRLDVNGVYRFYGYGQDLFNNNPNNTNLYGGQPKFRLQHRGDQLAGRAGLRPIPRVAIGCEFAMPLGFRKELAQIRYYELNLAREKARLQDYELEVSNTIAAALRSVEYSYTVAQSVFNRRVATERQVEAVQAAFDAETLTLDLLLAAQQARADAESSYFRVLTDYAKSITNIHFRKGSLLEYDGVYLAEGPWPAKAKFDAYRLARQRDASFFLDYGFTRPRTSARVRIANSPRVRNPRPRRPPLTSPDDALPSGATPETVPPSPPAPARLRRPAARPNDRSAHNEPVGAGVGARGSDANRGLPVRRSTKTDCGQTATATRPAVRRDDAVEPANYSWKTRPQNELARTSRLIQLIGLLQTGKGLNANELSDACGVSRRTTFVIWTSAASGRAADIRQSSRACTGSRHRITCLPPISRPTRHWPWWCFAAIWAGRPRAILRGAQAAAFQAGKQFARSAARAIARGGRSRADSHAAEQLAGWPAAVLRAIAPLHRSPPGVRIHYESFSEDTEIVTKLSPYQLLFSRHSWYAIGRSSLHRETRTFNVSRIRSLEPWRIFRNPPRVQHRTLLGQRRHLIPEPGPDQRVTVRFERLVARNVAEVVWHKTQRCEFLADGRLEFSVTVSGLNEISWWILGYGDQAEVLAPSVLRTLIAARAAGLVRRYRTDPTVL